MTIIVIDYESPYSKGHIEMTYELFKKKCVKIRRLFKDCTWVKLEERKIK